MAIQSSDDSAVILVDERDNATGTAAKLIAHQGAGMLHRAFSVFVFDSANRLLVQRRSASKYHFAGVWANTCCSHPRPGETVAAAAHRRLNEEMGFDCTLDERFSFTYHAESPNGLVESEFDHVLTGMFLGTVSPNRSEVESWKWIAPPDLLEDMTEKPAEFAPWFRISAPRVFKELHLL